MNKRCSFCILPASLPGMALDENDKCNYCREFESRYASTVDKKDTDRRKSFEKVLEWSTGKGKYDCLVPLSGGKDSSYVLYLLAKRYNMRVLAFNVDNGFRSDQAVCNIEQMVNQLGADFITYKPRVDMMYNLFKVFLVTAGEFCTPCNMLINAATFRCAQQYGIKTVMTGNSQRMAVGLEGASPATYYDRKYYMNVIEGHISREQIENYIIPPYVRATLRRLTGIGPRVINVFDYFRLDVGNIAETLRKEFGWERPGGDIQHGDCLLNPVKDFLMCNKWGCSEVTVVYGLCVRTGELTREEALAKAQAEEHSEPPPVAPEFLEAIGMTETEFGEALKKDFRKIPNLRKTTLFRLAKRVVQKVEQLRG